MRILCRLGFHEWKFVGIIGNPEYKLFRCCYCLIEKKKPNENDPHWFYS